MRYSLAYNKQADDFVRKDGLWEFALYVGHFYGMPNVGEQTHDWLAFRPMHADSRRYIEGLPIYVLIDENEIRFTDVDDCFEVGEQILKHDIYAKGRKIFKEYQRKFFDDDFASPKERDYIRGIIQATMNWYECPIEQNDLYLFLQESKRLGRPIEIVPDEEENRGKHDGWVYYLKLK